MLPSTSFAASLLTAATGTALPSFYWWTNILRRSCPGKPEYINKDDTMGGAQYFLPDVMNITSLQSEPQQLMTGASQTNCSHAV